jgi:hypothetical protein
MIEEFLPIKDYPNYKASNYGYIYSIKTNRKLKPFISNSGYETISLCCDGKSKKFMVHRLIALTFLNKNNKMQVNHKDGNKLNNKVTNLEWCTSSLNIKHAYKNKLIKQPNGENHFRSKISNEQYKELLSLIQKGLKLKEISKKYNISESYVCHIKNGKGRIND